MGWLFYHYGEIYILGLFNGDQLLTGAVNNTLLTGYYLINLGYATYTLRYWETIESFTQLIGTVASNSGTIILALGLMHFFNLAAISQLGKSQFLATQVQRRAAVD
ncbi:hypothetical protein JYT14_00670 [Flavobacteriales bacterium AH-315-E23]|nr:hypothetical protein [Flavobacteriales bacterium AH-315-E23]